MKISVYAAVAILGTISIAGVAQAMQEGKYVCVTDRAVGFQTPASGPRYSGAINLGADQQRFFVTLRKTKDIDIDDPDLWLDPNFLDHDAKTCFSKNTMESLKEEWRDGKRRNFLLPSIETFPEQCLARYALRISSDANGETLYADNPHVYHSFHNKFWIDQSMSFLWHWHQGANVYMAEGRCEHIQ